MTTQHTAVAAAGAGSALARCVGNTERFLSDCWGKRAHLYPEADVAGLLSLDAVDGLVSSTALRAPAFRVVKAGATLDASTYTRRARIGSRTITDLIDVGRVYAHFNDGATIVLQGLHRYWPPVAELCRSLEAELTHPVQANAYITPPVAQGLRVHGDPHDVFALQTHGRKQWVVYEGEQQPEPDGSGATPTLDLQLSPGNCLYIPKGTAHAARTVDSASIHLTLGVRSVTWADVLRATVERATNGGSLDEALPPGFANDPGALEVQARRRLQEVADHLAASDAAAAVDAAAARFWRARAPALQGQLRQLLSSDAIDDETVVRPRPHAFWDLSVAGDIAVVSLGDRTLRMPAAVEPALRQIQGSDQFAVADLTEHLDAAGRATLVRRLVREGLLLVVDG